MYLLYLHFTLILPSINVTLNLPSLYDTILSSVLHRLTRNENRINFRLLSLSLHFYLPSIYPHFTLEISYPHITLNMRNILPSFYPRFCVILESFSLSCEDKTKLSFTLILPSCIHWFYLHFTLILPSNNVTLNLPSLYDTILSSVLHRLHA
jgi:hypothetical protein